MRSVSGFAPPRAAFGGGGNLGSSAAGSNASTNTTDRTRLGVVLQCARHRRGHRALACRRTAWRNAWSGWGRSPPHVRYATTASHTHAGDEQHGHLRGVLVIEKVGSRGRTRRSRREVRERRESAFWRYRTRPSRCVSFVSDAIDISDAVPRASRARTCVMMELLCSSRRISAMVLVQSSRSPRRAFFLDLGARSSGLEIEPNAGLLLARGPVPVLPRVAVLGRGRGVLGRVLKRPCVAMANDLSFLPGTPQTRCGACLCGDSGVQSKSRCFTVVTFVLRRCFIICFRDRRY